MMYTVRAKSGRVMGNYETKAEAEARIAQLNSLGRRRTARSLKTRASASPLGNGEVIPYRRYKKNTGATASIYGAVPWTGAPGNREKDWHIETAGWTIRWNNGTTGIGRPPFATKQEAEEFLQKRAARLASYGKQGSPRLTPAERAWHRQMREHGITPPTPHEIAGYTHEEVRSAARYLARTGSLPEGISARASRWIQQHGSAFKGMVTSKKSWDHFSVNRKRHKS